MDFYSFHLMPWPYVGSRVDDYESSWVIFPNKHFDPEVGHELYQRYLDELVYAETLGFDGLCVNEHHQNAYGLMPSPNIMAAALVQATSRARIALVGNGLPLRDHPTRLAEEVAMLDVLSGGRIISGFVRTIGPDYHSLGVDPTRSRERFREAHDLIIKAWTSREPFEWISKNYKLRHVNIWPRPLQQPHPPVWVPTFGSPETLRFVAEHRYTFLSQTIFTSHATMTRWFDQFREICSQEFGYSPAPSQMGMLTAVYVAETDERAHHEARPHIDYFYRAGLKFPMELLFPPGYLSAGALRGILAGGPGGFGQTTYDERVRDGYVIVGSPETVRNALDEIQARLGIGVFIPVLQIGDMPHDKTMRNLELFAKEVMPHFREAADHAA